jgi:hypothetical protein
MNIKIWLKQKFKKYKMDNIPKKNQFYCNLKY